MTVCSVFNLLYAFKKSPPCALVHSSCSLHPSLVLFFIFLHFLSVMVVVHSRALWFVALCVIISLLVSFSGQLYGLEKFWAYLKYSKARNLVILPALQECLCQFNRLEDFRVEVRASPRNVSFLKNIKFII